MEEPGNNGCECPLYHVKEGDECVFKNPYNCPDAFCFRENFHS